MIEEFKKHRCTLYAGRLPHSPKVGPIQPDGSVVDDRGTPRFQIVGDGLYAMNSVLVGQIFRMEEGEWAVPDAAHNIIYSIRRDR